MWRFVLAMVAVMAAIAILLAGGGTSSATEPPPVPTTAPGVNASESIMTFSGSTLSLSIPAQPTLNIHGDDVGLGGAYSCAETGCIYYGISWQVIGTAQVDFVLGCDGTGWSCQLTFTQDGTGTRGWTEVRAVFGRTNGSLFAKSFFVWAPPTMQHVAFQSVGYQAEGLPDTTAISSGDLAYVVRGGTAPTLGSCKPPYWWEPHKFEVPPPTPDCVQLNAPFSGYGNWSTYLPVGSGPWVVYPFVAEDQEPTILVANADRYTSCGPRGCGTWPPFNVVMIDDEAMLVDADWVPNSSGSSTTTTTTSATSSSTTTTTIGGGAPQPPVVTDAVPGGPSGPGVGSVTGTAEGPPGATVTVTIAGNVGDTCARQMAGTGVVVVGAKSVTFDSGGEASFTINGPVQASSYLYGTAGASTVGDCYEVSPFIDVPWSHPFVHDIVWLVEHGITSGFADGTFRPGVDVTRQSMAAFLYRLDAEFGAVVPRGSCPGGDAFRDVVSTHPFCSEIQWMIDEGITTGFDDGTFRPGAPVTRQSLSAFLYRLAGSPAGDDPACAGAAFPDVPASHPFCGEIAWMVGAGVTTGFVDGDFRPGSVVSRQAMAAFVHRFALLPA